VGAEIGSLLHKNPHLLNRDMLSEAYHPANFMTQGDPHVILTYPTTE